MRIFTQFDGDLKSVWGKALSREPVAYPFYSFDWHAAWHRHFGDNESVAVLADTKRNLIFPLSVHGETAHFTGGEEIADYLDAFGGDEKGVAWQEATAELKSLGAVRMILRNIPGDSATLSYWKTTHATVSEEDSTPTLTLPKDGDAYLQALPRKERHEIRRKMKRFEEAYPETSFTRLAEPDMELAEGLMRRNPDKDAFLTPQMVSFFRDLPQICGGTLEQYVLTFAGQPAAMALAIRSGASLLLYNSGYDPAVAGSGWYLKAKIIYHAIEARLASVNFLQGKERYKYEFGAVDAPVYRIESEL